MSIPDKVKIINVFIKKNENAVEKIY